MSAPSGLHGQILRSATIIGGSSVITILIGLVRVKVVATLLGPAGVGMTSVLGSVMSTAAAIAGLGLSSSGVRQIAAATDDVTRAAARRALWYGSVALGALGAFTLWILKEPISTWVFGSPMRAAEVGWLGVGVLFSLVASSRTALLHGMRRISDLARSSILGGSLATILGIVVVWWLHDEGIIWYVVLGPLAAASAAAWYARTIPRLEAGPGPLQPILSQFGEMATLGIVVVTSSLMSGLTELALRATLTQKLGIEATGHFQAAWSISVTYVGLVLGAMAADFFPRLASSIKDEQTANTLINQQTEVSLLLAGPVLIAILAVAPWVIRWLYAEGFAPAVDVLRWQMIGDIPRVMTWAIGYSLIARRQGRSLILAEAAWNLTYLVFVWALLPLLQLASMGVGFAVSSIVHFALTYQIVRATSGFRLARRNLAYGVGMLAVAAVTFVACYASPNLGALLGVTLASLLGLYSLRRLIALTSAPTR